jgi:putative PIN family toxin of toxin-antitoxin system
MLRIVLDTDVLVAGITSSEGASRQVVLAVLDMQVRLLISTPLMIEYEAVLTRPHHLARWGLKTDEILELLDEFARICTPVAFDYRWRPTGADDDDEMVVETAINGQADIVATFNLRHMKNAGTRFGFIAQRPGSLLRRIRE